MLRSIRVIITRTTHSPPHPPHQPTHPSPSPSTSTSTQTTKYLGRIILQMLRLPNQLRQQPQVPLLVHLHPLQKAVVTVWCCVWRWWVLVLGVGLGGWVEGMVGRVVHLHPLQESRIHESGFGRWHWVGWVSTPRFGLGCDRIEAGRRTGAFLDGRIRTHAHTDTRLRTSGAPPASPFFRSLWLAGGGGLACVVGRQRACVWCGGQWGRSEREESKCHAQGTQQARSVLRRVAQPTQQRISEPSEAARCASIGFGCVIRAGRVY